MAALSSDRRNLRVGVTAALAALAMLALGFAAVPLYRIFCQVTGFGGTTQVASAAEADDAAARAGSIAAGEVSVRFDANTAPDLPWAFAPLTVTDKVRYGARDMAFFTAKNLSDKPITGTASFNVEPEQAGQYFNKVQCFCFTEQTLQPGEEIEMPVLFYVDPRALDDPDMKNVEQITLSYTFHRADKPTAD